MTAKALTREHTAYPQNLAPAWRNRLKPDELPKLAPIRRTDKIRRKDWQ